MRRNRQREWPAGKPSYGGGQRVDQRRSMAIRMRGRRHLLAVLDAFEVARNMRHTFISRFPHYTVTTAGDDDQFCARDKASNSPRVLRRNQPIQIAGQNEGGLTN